MNGTLTNWKKSSAGNLLEKVNQTATQKFKPGRNITEVIPMITHRGPCTTEFSKPIGSHPSRMKKYGFGVSAQLLVQLSQDRPTHIAATCLAKGILQEGVVLGTRQHGRRCWSSLVTPSPCLASWLSDLCINMLQLSSIMLSMDGASNPHCLARGKPAPHPAAPRNS